MNKRFVFFYAVFSAFLILTLIYITKQWDKNKDELSKENNIKEEINNTIKYINDNRIKDKIKVKITSTNEVIEMSVSDYLKGVVPSEMPPDYNKEALKAQAVVARTYLFNKMNTKAHADADICDSPNHCQAFYTKDKLFQIWGTSKGWNEKKKNTYFKKISEAVDSTDNIVVTYNNKYIKAYFHACSAGKTENVYNIWGKQNIPYLKSVESIEDKDYKNYTSKKTYTISELQEKLNKENSIKCSIDENGGDIAHILSLTDTGRVDKVKIGGVIYKAEELRNILGLRSTNFNITYNENKVIFNVKGNGHGVGMSQVGANYYASIGYTYDKIITHYYTGVDITYVNKGGKTNEN